MRDADAQITFADLEFLQQGIRLDPLLQKISDFLDDHNELVELVRCDLERGLKEPGTGRPGLTPGQVLRSLILMRVKNWDYRELRERINDGYTLRKFTAFYSQPVPRHNAFNQAFNRLSAATVENLNDAIVEAAVDDGLEGARRYDSCGNRYPLAHRCHVTLGHGSGSQPLDRASARDRSQRRAWFSQPQASGAQTDAEAPTHDGGST